MPKKQQKQAISISLLIAIVLGVCIWLLCSTIDNLCWCNNPPCDTTVNNSDKPNDINFYMESSISVREYMNTKEGTFTKNINNFLAVLPRYCKSSKLKIYIVGSNSPNEETMEVKYFNRSSKEFRDSIRAAAKSLFKYSHSHLVNILDSVITYTPDSNVSFLVSDCIYSHDSQTTIREIKDNLGSELAPVLRKINNKGLAIFQLSTYYNSTYYPESMKDRRIHLLDPDRPYYVLAFGKPWFLRNYLSNTSGFKSDLAYDNYLTMNVYDNSKVKPHLFWNTGNQNCKPKPRENTVQLTSSSDENEMTRFLIGLDLKGLPYFIQNENYLEDKLEFTNNLQRKKIRVYSKNNVDYTFKKEEKEAAQCTHFLEVSFSDISLDKTELTIKVPFFLPNWYKDVSTDVDYPKDSTKGKTYGFEYFVQGLKEGYGLKDSTFFQFKITVKK